MSQENVEIVRRAIEAWNWRDETRESACWRFDAEIDWSRSRGPLKGVYRGEAEREVFADGFRTTFEAVQVEAHGFVEAGSEVVVPNTAHFRGRDGIEVIARSTFVYTLENGLIIRLRMFQERAEALEAAGLSEWAMSQENVDLVRALNDAANRGDIDAGAALLAPDVVWEENLELLGLKEVYRGRDEFRRWAEQILEVFEGLHQELDQITELSGDRVFIEHALTAHGKGSGVPTELRYWAVYWIKEDKIARRQVFWNRDEALEAAGLSE